MASLPANRRSILAVIRGILLIAAITAICFRAGLNPASTALVYVIAVALHSLDCTFRESVIISVLAVLSLDFFFLEPLFLFTVAKGLDVVTLACLLTTCLVITRLQSRMRITAAESRLQRESMSRLYNVSQALLGLDFGSAFSTALLKSILTEFELKAVCLFDADTLESQIAGAASPALEAGTRDAYVSGRDSDDPEQGIAVRCLRLRGSAVGAIGFQGLRDPELTAPPLAALATAAIARARAFRSAADAAAQARAETLRSAVLDALAHEIKTPLAAILTAAGGIRAVGSMQPQQEELAELIESEAARLGDLTSRLLRVARLDQEEIRPRLERMSVAQIAGAAARRYAKLWQDRRIRCDVADTGVEVRADPELILLAVSQLAENACRYSQPDTEVVVQASSNGDTASITVTNVGAPIPASERSRIFERFYRGTEARRNAPGSGLGLYVARKIAVAHGGDLALVDTGGRLVTFRLSLPLAGNEDSLGAL